MKTLVRRNDISKNRPLSLFDQVFGENFFDDFRSSIPPVVSSSNQALMDMYEDDSNVYVEVNVPGYTLDQIDLAIESGTLFVSGKTEQRKEDSTKVYHRRERSLAQFTRAVTLPRNVNQNKIEAELVGGILKVVMPKDEESKVRKIQITQK